MKRGQKFLLFIVIILCNCCNQKKTNDDFVISVRMLQDVESLNPLSTNTFHADKILHLLFQSLMTIDHSDELLKPSLAESYPEITQNDSLTYLTYSIRPKAMWDSSHQVTASDVEFTLKMIKAPLVNNEKKKLALDFIQDIKLYANEPKKFTLICKNFVPEKLTATGDFYILPEYMVDNEGLMKKYTVYQLHKNAETFAQDENLNQIANFYNSTRFTRDAAFLKGSAAYYIHHWQSGQYIEVRKKKDWWGNKLNIPWITAHPEVVFFRVISDDAAALIALKNEELDVYDEIPVHHFELLEKNVELQQKYNFYRAKSYYLHYIGLNGNGLPFADSKTRKAFYWLFDVPQIISTVYNGNAEATAGFVHPANKKFYNDTIILPALNIEKCKSLLVQAGWKWSGKIWVKNNQKLALTIQYKAGTHEYENICLIFQQAAKQVGIPVDIQPVESSLLKQNLKSQNFDMYLSYMGGTPLSYNYKSILHTSAAITGANYTGFGNYKTDSLIIEINKEANETKKAQLLKQFQAEFTKQAYIIPLFYGKNLIAINKKIDDVHISSIKPGYHINTFKKR